MTTHIPHLKTDTSEGYRNYINAVIKEVKETMPIQYWHESNQFCRDWWDCIEQGDYMVIAGIDVGCVNIECRIDNDLDFESQKITYYLNTKLQNGSWESSNYINILDFNTISKLITWEDIFNDMLYNLIEHCLEYDIDYEADYWCIKEDLLIVLKNKLNDEFKKYTTYLKENCVNKDEIISYHYVITMKYEFEIAIKELAEKMTPKEIRKTFLEKEDILENLFQKFIKKDTGEMDIYKEFILNTIKEEK